MCSISYPKTFNEYFKEKRKWFFSIATLLICAVIAFNVLVLQGLSLQSEKQKILLIKVYQQLVENLIIDCIENIILISRPNKVGYAVTQSIQTSLISDYIKNSIFIPKSLILDKKEKQHTDLYFINIYELLNEVSNEFFDYAVFLNNEKVLSNNSFIDINDSYHVTYKFAQGIVDVYSQINKNSEYIKNTNLIFKRQIIFCLLCSGLFLTLVIILSILRYKRNFNNGLKLSNLQEEIIHLKGKLKAHTSLKEKDTEFILRCYQFSKDNVFKNSHLKSMNCLDSTNNDDLNRDYLPLPILTYPIEDFSKHEIDLIPIIQEITSYFEWYIIIYDVNLRLIINNSTNKILTPFRVELFNQIAMSLFCNILNFNKHAENLKYIKIEFSEDAMMIITDGFLLDKHLVIRYSEKIFNDTGNLFLLSLGQVFAVLKLHKLDYSVSAVGKETKIEIKLNSSRVSEVSSTNQHYPEKVVKIKNFIRSRVKND